MAEKYGPAPCARRRRGPPRTAPSARTHGSCVTVQERQDDSNGQTVNGAAPRRRPERQRHDHIFVVGWCRSCPDCCGRCRCAARSRQSLPVRPRDTSTASRCRRLRRDDSKTLSCLTCATFPRVQRVRNEHARSSLPRRTSPARLAAPDGTFRKRPSHHRRSSMSGPALTKCRSRGSSYCHGPSSDSLYPAACNPSHTQCRTEDWSPVWYEWTSASVPIFSLGLRSPVPVSPGLRLGTPVPVYPSSGLWTALSRPSPFQSHPVPSSPMCGRATSRS